MSDLPTVPAPAPASAEAVAAVVEAEAVAEEGAEDATAPDDAPPSEESSDDERTPGTPASELQTLKDCYANGTIPTTSSGDLDPAFTFDDALNDKVIVWRGDITKLSVDAIVNAANKALLGGGGVDGAIHSAAGPGLYDECVPLGGTETGTSKITGGHDLPARHVIHTVGPIYSRSRPAVSERLLRSCYQTTLELAVENSCRTLAFSGISTGVYGYPIDAATRVALEVTRKFLESGDGSKLDKVIFTVFRPVDVNSYKSLVADYFPAAAAEAEEEEAEEEPEAVAP